MEIFDIIKSVIFGIVEGITKASVRPPGGISAAPAT